MVPIFHVYERFLINGWLGIYLKKPEKEDSSFKGVLDHDLQPHPGAGTLESGVMMGMPTLRSKYDLFSDSLLLRYTALEKL